MCLIVFLTDEFNCLKQKDDGQLNFYIGFAGNSLISQKTFIFIV